MTQCATRKHRARGPMVPVPLPLSQIRYSYYSSNRPTLPLRWCRRWPLQVWISGLWSPISDIGSPVSPFLMRCTHQALTATTLTWFLVKWPACRERERAPLPPISTSKVDSTGPFLFFDAAHVIRGDLSRASLVRVHPSGQCCHGQGQGFRVLFWASSPPIHFICRGGEV